MGNPSPTRASEDRFMMRSIIDPWSQNTVFVWWRHLTGRSISLPIVSSLVLLLPVQLCCRAAGVLWILPIIHTFGTKGRRWRILVHTGDGIRICVYNRTWDQDGLQKIHSHSSKIFLHCHIESNHQEKPRDKSSSWDTRRVSECQSPAPHYSRETALVPPHLGTSSCNKISALVSEKSLWCFSINLQ